MSLTGYLEAKQKLVGKLTRIPELDKTLTKEGYSADAAAVGAALSEKVPISHLNDKNNPHGVTAAQAGADAAGTAETVTARHNVAVDSHNDIRLLIDGLTSRLNALANCDDTTLDQMAEVVEYIKANRELIDSITTSKVSVTDIVDNLTTNVADKPLSAAQGIALKVLIDELSIVHGTHEANKNNPHGVTAVQAGAAPAIESADYAGCYYRMVGGETEWINPPMMTGTEYRTTERYEGKPVYVQTFFIEALPNAAVQTYSISSVGARSIVRCYGRTNDVMSRTMPFELTEARNSLACDRSKIYIKTTTDESMIGAYITVHYTKE